MPEIAARDIDNVAAFIAKTFGVVNKQLAHDYARIAAYLSVPDGWQPDLAGVSGMLADEYQAFAIYGHGNRLSKAITAVARSLGFGPYDNGVILAGFTAEERFKDYVRGRAFWKDAVSSNHGEHSHSLQWLALGRAAASKRLGVTNKIAELYSRTVDFKSGKTFAHPQRGANQEIYLWDFLVDCFDYGADPDWQTNISTATARSPTALNKYVHQNAETLWIGAYLRDRYDKRGWGVVGQGTSIKEHAISKAKGRGFKFIEANSGGNEVYERRAATASDKAIAIPGTRKATLTVSIPPWGDNPKPSYTLDWKTQAGTRVAVGVAEPIPDSCKTKGTHDVEVSVAKGASGYLATIVRRLG